MWVDPARRVAGDATDPTELTTDPPRPPGTPDVDELVGDPVPTGAGPAGRGGPGPGSEKEVPDDEDVASDTVSVEPPD